MIFFESDTDSENEDKINLKLHRKWLRDNSNILNLPEQEFVKHFRVTKEVFQIILNDVQFPLGSSSSAIPPILQLAATLEILASGGYQTNVGSDVLLSMAQTTVSKIFRNTIALLEEKLCERWIKINPNNFAESKSYFYNKFRIPGIVGVIDGTHIPILKPKDNEHMYFNRKGYHSLNVMLVANEKYEIMSVDSRYGGASHDSFVYSMSGVRVFFEEKFKAGDNSTRILGDSGYPLEPWLLVPYRSADENSSEKRFNDILSQARCLIERVIGVLKGRWRCLSSDRKMRISPAKAVNVVNVCVALHNICIYYKIPTTEHHIIENSSDNENTGLVEYTEIDSLRRKAEIIRNNIKNSL